MVFVSLIIPLLLSSGPAYAEWVPVEETEDGMKAYVDHDTIRRKGDRVKIWHIFDEKIKKTVGGITYLSSMVQSELGCPGRAHAQACDIVSL